ncbi:hypothetical protein DYL61_19850 [Pseudomonas nabeulensis]|uniref:Dermonecrotic toxin N-terminal domain-containing protein n=1 Tax=Pseudomonas nabeulensis TaxID=2293833 RepID=A0A4Z0AVW2_9PSED|nr:DUF6543 domain-containing protein [Pseudomonas nabeulensis]TFY90946.1 hypothetical protein DYL61_19850 [Pseudomonas nabeulensis]
MVSPASLPISTSSLSLAQTIRRYFRSRPSLQEVAVNVLQGSLGRRYRWLTIDQTQPVVLEPIYRNDGKMSVLQGYNSLTLADALIERCVTGLFVDYSQGQILAANPRESSPTPLHVKNSDLEEIINEQGAVLLDRYQEALVNFWMATDVDHQVRYVWLADTLKNALMEAATNVGLTGVQLDMVVEVVNQPMPSVKNAKVQAYLIDHWGESGAINLEMLRGLVLVRRHREGDTVLLFTLSRGIQVFDSLAELGDWLVNLLTLIPDGHTMQWRLYQPKGNVFHSFSLAFLVKQLSDIGIVLPVVRTFDNRQRLLERTLRVISSDFDTAPIHSTELTRLRAALPAWLTQADTDMQMEMSRYAVDLARHVAEPGWRPFDEGIPSLQAFACAKLAAQLATDYPTQPTLDPDHVRLTMDIEESDAKARTKIFWTVPPLYTQGSWSLSEFAWLALPGLDSKKLKVVPAGEQGEAVWLTAEQVLTLLENANVRGGYDQLISSKLMGNEDEVKWRKARFIEQLRVQLPMLALENHLKYPQSFSRQAYTCVVDALNAQAPHTEQEVVVRQLGFQIRQEEVVDHVTNMFIIGPQDINEGPHILYRPMTEVKMIEFSTWRDLQAAIIRPGPLQYEVMAWMEPATRDRYLLPGLPVPGLAAFELVDFNDMLWANPDLVLAQDVIEGDYLEYFFDSAVRALCSVANPQPPSGLEVFWGWLKRFFGLGLALVLPFLGGPVGEAAGWLLLGWIAWQDIRDIVTADPKGKLLSIADLLLNIGLLLLGRGYVATRVGTGLAAEALLDMAEGADFEHTIEMSWREDPEALLEGGQSSKSPRTSVQLPTVEGDSAFIRGDSMLERSWSGLYSRLSVIRQAELALYKVRVPATKQRIHTGDYRGLYRAGDNLYVSFDDDWFKVEEQGGVMRLVNDDIAPREGPTLVHRGSGSWGFAAEPAQPEELSQALALEQQRLAQLQSDEQRRMDLDAEYDRLFKMFNAQVFTDDSVLGDISRRFAEPGNDQLIEDELAKADLSHWCAITLLDALTRRRGFMVVRDYSTLHSRFAASAVWARRNQVMMYAAKRNLRLKQDGIEPSAFDAPNLGAMVLDTAGWRSLSSSLPDYAALQEKAVNASQEAERRFASMKLEGRVADASVALLDVPAWAGRHMSLKWQELQLRTLAMLCFSAKVPAYKDATLDLIQEVTNLCSLKLMAWRELFTPGRFNWDSHLRVMNDVLDSLVLANSRLSYQLESVPAFINTWALGNYRSYVRSLMRDAEDDLIAAYQQYEGAGTQAVVAKPGSGTTRMIEDGVQGVVIGMRREVEELGEQQVYLDVLEPFDHRRIWSFKRYGGDTDEGWREVARAEAEPPISGYSHEQLADIGVEASRLWRDAGQQFVRTASLESIRRMSALRVRSEWRNYANRMIKQRELLMAALKTLAVSEAHQDLLDFFKNVPSELYDEIMRFMAQSVDVPQRMIMRGYPSSEGLLMLYNAWKIEVVELPSEANLLRHFEVRERSTGRPLWFARFNYDTSNARNVGYHFTQGNLKRYAERDTSYATLKRRASNKELMINVLRGNIDHEVAQAVFFTEDIGAR